MAAVTPLSLSRITSRRSLMARVLACLRKRSATFAFEGSMAAVSYATAIGNALASRIKGHGTCSLCAMM
eukprot:1470806-Rhodomonas_salina.1